MPAVVDDPVDEPEIEEPLAPARPTTPQPAPSTPSGVVFQTPDELAAKIKSKFPVYNSQSNDTIVRGVLKKYPAYWKSVNREKFAAASIFEGVPKGAPTIGPMTRRYGVNGTVGEALKSVLLNTSLGAAVERTFPRFAEWTGIHPSENPYAAGNEEHRNQLLAPENIMQAIVHKPENQRGVGERFATGLLRGAGGFTTPGNLVLMAVPVGGVAGVFGKGAIEVLPRLVSGGFSLQMIYSLYQQVPQFKKAMEAGDYGTAAEMAGEAIPAIMGAGLAAHHAAFGGPGEAAPRPKPIPEPKIAPEAVEAYRRQQAATRARDAGKPEEATETPRVRAEAAERQRRAGESEEQHAQRIREQRQSEEESVRRRQVQQERQQRRLEKARQRPSIAAPPAPGTPQGFWHGNHTIVDGQDRYDTEPHIQAEMAKGYSRQEAYERVVKQGQDSGRTVLDATEDGDTLVDSQGGRWRVDHKGGYITLLDENGNDTESVYPIARPEREVTLRNGTKKKMPATEHDKGAIAVAADSRIERAKPPEETDFGRALRSALGAPQGASAEPGAPAFEPRIEEIGEMVGRAAERSGQPTLEGLVRGFAEQRMMTPEELRADIEGRHRIRRTKDENAWLYNYKRMLGEPTTEPAPPPPDTDFGAKLRKAMQQPVKPKAAPAPEPTPPGVERVAAGVQRAAETSRPDLGEIVRRGAEQRMATPEELAADLHRKHPSRRTPEERAWLANYHRWSGLEPPPPPTAPRVEPEPPAPPAAPAAAAPEPVTPPVEGETGGRETPEPEAAEPEGKAPPAPEEPAGEKPLTEEEKERIAYHNAGLPGGVSDAWVRKIQAKAAELRERHPDWNDAQVRAFAETEVGIETKGKIGDEFAPTKDKKLKAAQQAFLNAYKRAIKDERKGGERKGADELDEDIRTNFLLGAFTRSEADAIAAAIGHRGSDGRVGYDSPWHAWGHMRRALEDAQPQESPAGKLEEPPAPSAAPEPEAKPVEVPPTTGAAGELEKAKNELAKQIRVWQMMREGSRGKEMAQKRVDKARAEVDRLQAAVDAAPKPPADLGRSATLGSPEEPLYWPEEEQNVYFKDGSWYMQDPETEEWIKAPPDDHNELTFALKSKKLLQRIKPSARDVATARRWGAKPKPEEPAAPAAPVDAARKAYDDALRAFQDFNDKTKTKNRLTDAEIKEKQRLSDALRAAKLELQGARTQAAAGEIEEPPAPEPTPAAAEPEPKSPPIVKFKRMAAAIREKLPEIKKGHTRLWRGNRPGEVGTATQFTSDLPGIAMPFAEGYGGPLTWVDVPTADLEKYKAGPGATDAEYNLPPELAKKIGGTVDMKTGEPGAAPRPGPKKIEEPPAPEPEGAPPHTAPGTLSPDELKELEEKHRDLTEQKRNAKYIEQQEVIQKKIDAIDRRFADHNQKMRYASVPETKPDKPVHIDKRDPHKGQHEWFTNVLGQVRDAYMRQLPKHLKWEDISSPKANFTAPRPPEFPNAHIHIKVPGDGEFLINNDAKNIAKTLKGAATAFRKPSKLGSSGIPVPRAPKEFDVDAHLAQLDAEDKELREELSHAEGDRAAQIREQLQANAENRYFALHGEEMPKGAAAPEAPPAAAPAVETKKTTPATKARPASEVEADYRAGVQEYTGSPDEIPEGHNSSSIYSGLAKVLDRSGLEPDPEHVLKGNTTGRSPWFWELADLFQHPLNTAVRALESSKRVGEVMDKMVPTLAHKVETDKLDWMFRGDRSADVMRKSLEEGDYAKRLAQAERFAQRQRRMAQIVEAIRGESKNTRAARIAADDTDLEVAQKRAYAEGEIAKKEKAEAEKEAEKAQAPFRRAERMRPMAALKLKPNDAWTPFDRGRGVVAFKEGNIISDSATAIDLDKPMLDTKAANKVKEKITGIEPNEKRVDTTLEKLAGEDRKPLTFVGYQDEGGEVGEVGYFTMPDDTLVGIDPQRVKMLQTLFGDDLTFEGAAPDKPVLVKKNGETVGVISPMKITEGHIDLPTARKTLSVRGKAPLKDVAAGGRGGGRGREREVLEAPPRPPSEAQQTLFADQPAGAEPYRNMPGRPRGPAPAPAGAPRQQVAARPPEPPVTDEELRAYTGPGVPPPENPLHKKAKEFRETVKGASQWVRKQVAAATLDPDARQMALHERTRLARIANQEAKYHAALTKARKALNKLGDQGRVAFLLAAEGGKKFENPQLQEFADTWKTIQDKLWRQVQRRAGIRKYVENFWPHYWKDENAATAFGENWINKRSLEGRKEYLKKRSYPTIQEGLDAGLVLQTTDPIDMQMRKIHSMLQFISGDDTFENMKDLGTAKFSWGNVGRAPHIPQDWVVAPQPWGKVVAPKAITLREAVDKNLFAKLNDFARSLGILHMREQPMNDGTLGWYDPSTGDVVTKIATPLGTLTHEIGHALDYQYGPKGQTIWETMQKIPGDRGRTIRRELKALADMRFAGAEDRTSANYKKYVRKGTEKMANMFDAFVNMPWLFDQNHPDAVAPTVGQWLKGYLASDPRLRPLLKINPSLVRSTVDHKLTTGELDHVGSWYIPPSAKLILDRSMSPGLQNNPAFKTLRWGSNHMVAARLSFSGRHMLFTAFEPMASHFARGIKQVTQGRFGEAGKSFLKSSPYAIASSLIKGHRAFKDFYGSGVDGVETQKIFKDITAAGGRFQQDQWYNQRAIESLVNRWQEGRKAAALSHLPMAAVEAFAYPTLKWWVPRMKLGIFLENAGEEMANKPFTVNDVFRFGSHYFDGLKPEARAYAEEVAHAIDSGMEPERPEDMDERTAERIENRVGEIYQHSRQMKTRETLQNVWDSVDNRLGQVVYDNLFWDRALKEVGQGGVQSLGWNLGFFKEFGGGAIDIAKWAARKKELSMKAAYTMAYPMVLGMMGLMYQYIKTGRKPQTGSDWRTDPFFPHNGDGDERVNLPSYINDFYRYGRGYQYGLMEGFKESGRELAAKTTPIFSTMNEMLQNRDFYGTQVYNPEDPLLKEMMEAAKHAGAAYIPYSISNVQRLTAATGKRPGFEDVIESFMGINKAPSSLSETRAEHLLREYAGAFRPSGAMTQEQHERLQERRQLAERLKLGDKTAQADIEKDIAAGKLQGTDWATIHDMSRNPWWENTAKRISLPQALHVWDEATPEERRKLAPILRAKGSQLWKLEPNTNGPLWQRWRKALEEMDNLPPISTPMGSTLQPPPAP